MTPAKSAILPEQEVLPLLSATLPSEAPEQPAFDETELLDQLKHYLPQQAPLKDFIHHNTLHAFQHLPFTDALRNASRIFGYKVSLSLDEYRVLYLQNKISHQILQRIVIQKKGQNDSNYWLSKLVEKPYDQSIPKKIGRLRKYWKEQYHLDLDTIVHTNLFRILNSYLDQGIAISKFPIHQSSFLESMRELEKNSYVSFFKRSRAKALLCDTHTTLEDLLAIVVGNEELYTQYVFDQQFAHPGWSGLVSVIEDMPASLLDSRKITLRELVFLELLLEIDNLDNALGKWIPPGEKITTGYTDLFDANAPTELDEVIAIWQEAYEWSYYDQVLRGVSLTTTTKEENKTPGFQAFFCIDDRNCSIRRYIEQLDPTAETYGTPGHFGIDTYYQPKHAKFYTKICPAPLTPKHLLREVSTKRENGSDLHFNKHSHSLLQGWLISQTLGFWSAIKLLFNIFKPSFSPSSTSSFNHMDEFSTLIVENRSPAHKKDGLQIGYTVDEMADRVESVLKSTGLTSNFSPIVYVIGHGASSANNTHYAGYDCGACSGRPGSANARAFSHMANHSGVRKKLRERGISIPDQTEFLGGLHDTTRDEFTFYDEEHLSPQNDELHEKNQDVFRKALRMNARERSRRFTSINTRERIARIHKKVKTRSVSLFEPRPELNHATNALCVIGRRALTSHLFLDRRSFLNSYNYSLDPDGKLLTGIVNAAAPVCGGINLEYFFSRVDNEKLGAGSKLPHNVMGLVGVANGFEGDLRPGLPLQMIEVHDPLRLLMVIEHFPEVVLHAIQVSSATYEWFFNEWVILTVINPETREIFRFRQGEFAPYEPLAKEPEVAPDLEQIIMSSRENLPVYKIN